MKIIKKAIRVIILFIVLLFLVRQFFPNYLTGSLAFLHPSNTPSEISQVLGAKNSKIIESSTKQAINYLMSLPIVQSSYEQATNYVESEINKLIKKPQEEVGKVKKDVREKVCEDWFAN